MPGNEYKRGEWGSETTGDLAKLKEGRKESEEEKRRKDGGIRHLFPSPHLAFPLTLFVDTASVQ